jgi:hypothetical protein
VDGSGGAGPPITVREVRLLMDGSGDTVSPGAGAGQGRGIRSEIELRFGR